ncbi:cytochrome c biogenesis CcdA family protein [Streptomyces albireticuli]|uniref:Cytochrome C biogenesis protein CcdA n=1 Tax=Streptomyces albireticuli TaxID=1940 RepID=A0A2A2DDW7_9ACTN|nr:cytochrome c biogenesis CcdA family protein [Streptomyces albireticuli]MCD9141590.1 cytochrome c biogenesis CcdA family protein [Streptomyces albireticuli]MCD9164159.1 cytochrome c biogenesis CcdA family protein [Streptomyces albireticuli]MCD9189764.1 cytochrome c biogenesis CcdA family protein [Streptomyces albireticuli]PAU49530.1 cytochrome C biogenesis protein CcdA [Streptomyces albireticuli]
MTDIGYLAAFLGGVLALVSPCSALLLPAFFAYSLTSPGRLLARTCVFYLGLATTLVPLGVASSAASRLFNGHRELLITIGGWTVIAMGAAQILGLGFASKRAQAAAGRITPRSAASTFLLGCVYGLAGFCAGPILGAVLTMSAVGGNPFLGGSLLAVYALGMALPLFVLALCWDRFRLGGRRWLRGRELRLGRLRLHTTSLLSGLFFIGIGVLFLAYDGTTGLPGLLDADQESRLEEFASAVGDAVPDYALLAVVALAVAGVLARIALRPERDPEGPEDPEDG